MEKVRELQEINSENTEDSLQQRQASVLIDKAIEQLAPSKKRCTSW